MKKPLLAPAAVAALTFLAFAGSLQNGFVNWDDRQALVYNEAWRGLGLANLRWMLTTGFLGHYQPLSWLSLGFDHVLWGGTPFGIHLTSLLLHCAAAVVAYFIALRLLKEPVAAAAAALLFSLHPLRVESVVWAAQRRDPLSGLFFLATILCWLDGRRRAALACAFLSLSAKITGVTLPAILLLLDVYWFKRDFRKSLLDKIPFAALSLLFLALNVWAQIDAATMAPLAKVGWATRLGNSAYSFVFYLGKTIWPAGLSTLYYGGGDADRLAVIIGAAAVALIAYGLTKPRLRPALAAACAFYAIALIPYLGLVKSGRQIAADRYTYVACLPWALLIAAAAKGRARAAVAAVLLALGAVTTHQTAVWHDSVSLWRQALKIEPLGDTARPLLAQGLLERGRTGEAVLYLEEQIGIFPADEYSRKMLADVVGPKGVSDAEHAKMHRELGQEFLDAGDKARADWHFRKAARYEERAGRL
ncbi:MAG: hypothetical protein HY923_01285 [Elusimicrobia bacterium]|nr:hypothetical protein [Elusimicrobiota bacterium]